MPSDTLSGRVRAGITRYAPSWVKILGNLVLSPVRNARLKRLQKAEESILPTLDEKYPVPPVSMRYRITGGTKLQSFLSSGRRSLEDLNAALGTQRKTLGDFRDILDFGCGCGRMLRHLEQFAPNGSICGMEIDGEAVEWCRRNLPFAEVVQTSMAPPSPWDEDRFDLVFGVSVFTHLSEDLQFRWLEELRRILRPGGFMLQTVLDEGTRNNTPLPRRAEADLEKSGFAFVRTGVMAGFLPIEYGTTYHTRDYIERTWSRFFHVREYVPQGMTGYQSIVVLRAPDA
jgi:SAM-dependent methyltransferase